MLKKITLITMVTVFTVGIIENTNAVIPLWKFPTEMQDEQRALLGEVRHFSDSLAEPLVKARDWLEPLADPRCYTETRDDVIKKVSELGITYEGQDPFPFDLKDEFVYCKMVLFIGNPYASEEEINESLTWAFDMSGKDLGRCFDICVLLSIGIPRVAINYSVRYSTISAVAGWFTSESPVETTFDNLNHEEVELIGLALRGRSNLIKFVMICYAGGKNPDLAERIKSIATAMRTNSTLESLIIFGFHINEEAAEEFGKAMSINQTLLELHFVKNKIRDAGVKPISEGLKVNSSLTCLSIASNCVEDSGAEHLSEALRVNSTLTSLGLQANCHIFRSGIESLADGLEHNYTMTSLDLSPITPYIPSTH